jgi:hypothetical protein
MPLTDHGLWYPDTATPVAPLHTLFATAQNSVEDALQTVDGTEIANITSYSERTFASAAERDAWYSANPTPALVAGMRCRVAGVSQRYTGSVWRNAPSLNGSMTRQWSGVRTTTDAIGGSGTLGSMVGLTIPGAQVVPGIYDVFAYGQVQIAAGTSTVWSMRLTSPNGTQRLDQTVPGGHVSSKAMVDRVVYNGGASDMAFSLQSGSTGLTMTFRGNPTPCEIKVTRVAEF